MKRRNHEEVYTSSARSSPRGKRLLSWLLSIVMLLSLLPGMELHAHAFWDDYDDGFDCPNCDHYHFGSDYMCDCLFCTIDCNYECWVETHCNDCGVCFGDTPYWCEECYKCAECMEEKHCSTCAKCYIGEDDQLCGECHKGPCCSITICDTCGFCDDCANDDSDPMHCSLCNACFGSVDECVDDDDTGVIHCVDCHTACEQCEECLLNQESCEDCGLCLECCRDNSEGGGCPDGETCVESAEWDEHICPGCDGWVTDKEDEDEFCETCELCRECCEGNSDCSTGMCAMDTDYADHFCEDCGLCFCDSDPCEDGCDQRCKDCCLDAVRAMGCEHDDWCFSDSDFEDHLKAEHSGAGHTHIASSSWSADGTQHWNPCRYCDEKMNPAGHESDAKGVCKVCGYISGNSIVITRQPKGVKCKTCIYSSGDYVEEPENGLLYDNWVTFSVTAKSLKGDELTYQWYQKDNANPTRAPYKLKETDYYVGVNTPTLKLSVSAEACQDDYSYFCVIGRKGDPSDTMKTAAAKLTATHAYSYQQAGEPVYTDDGKRTPEYKVTWVDKDGVTHNTSVGSVRKSDGHKLKCLFEESAIYEAHYMTTGSKERIFPHTFKLERSYDAVGGGRVDMLVCTVCDYFVFVKSHVHDYGWNWDCTGFDSIYEYTFNIGGSTKTVEQLILESGYAHPEKCKVPGCEEFIMVPHSWGRWNVVLCPDTTGSKGGMEAECSVCEYKETEKIDGDWTKDTAIVTVKNGRATRMIVKPGNKIKLYPDDKAGQKAIGWKVEYLREYNDGSPVKKNWSSTEAASLFKLVNNGSALEWGCTIPAFSAMGAPGGGQFFFEPVYAGCDHSGGTTVLNAKAQVCDRKGYTGDTACADCGQVISAGSDIYPPANAGHTGTLQPLYYYGTNLSATTDASHGGKRYNARSGDCKHRAYEGDYRCTACGGTVKGESGDFKHSGPFELRDVREATCTEKGYSGNQYCTACNKIAQKGASTPSLHEIAGNYQLINAVKPTCIAVGYSGDYQCTGDCGQIFRYGHVIDKFGHDWNSGETATQGKSSGILYTCRRVGCGETKFVKNPAATGYTVTVSNDGNGTGKADPSTAAAGTTITLTAKPNGGYHFKEWQVVTGSVTITNDQFTMPDGDVEVKAIFEEDAPPAPTDPAKPGISVTGIYTYNGSEHTATVTGYDSATMNITGNTATDAGDYTVSVTSKTGKWADGSADAVTAAWSIGKATQGAPIGLTGTAPTAEGGNDGKISGVTDKMEYRAATDSGYMACPDGEITGLSAGIYFVRYAEDSNHFASPDAAVIVGEGELPADCTITFNAGGGTGSMKPVTVKVGSNYILPACGFTAPTDQQFKAWEIDGTEYKVGASCTVNGNTEIKALWKGSAVIPTVHTVTVSNDGNGTGTASPSAAAAGMEIALTAAPNKGYHFKQWQVISGGVTITNNKFAMPAGDVEIKAIFEKNTPTGPIGPIGPIGPGTATYPITIQSGKNGGVTASHKSAAKGALVTLTVTPDKGYVLETLNAFDQNGSALPLTQQNGKYGFTMPASAVTVKATFMDDNTMLNFFVDVSASDYYYDAVLWAVGKSITGGTSATTFDPSGNCTRAQAVTFLWRAAGSPAPKTKVMPFTDVPADSYYHDAVLWAVEQGITKGTSDTAFSPNATCTRAQIVTFLWRAGGSPAVSGSAAFTDVASDAYYAAAVAWAEKNGVTGGIGGGLFGTGNTCTRAQIVTFLYRAMK